MAFSMNTHVGNSQEWDLKYMKYRHMTRKRAIDMLGGKCVQCGEIDTRILQFNHLKGDGADDRRRYKPMQFVHAILNGKRTTEDLDIRCANCQLLYEFETGRRQWLV